MEQKQYASYGKKFCQHCRTEIDKNAKICPVCRKKQHNKFVWIAVGGVVLLLLASMCSSGNNNSTPTNNTVTDNSTQPVQEQTQQSSPVVQQPIEQPKTYTPCTVGEMMDVLESNALKAETLYQDQYLEITGRLSVIDSDGKYISLVDANDQWAIKGVQCQIKNDEQRNQVMNMSKDDIVTLRGKITSIGEILGYSLDIDSIN